MQQKEQDVEKHNSHPLVIWKRTIRNAVYDETDTTVNRQLSSE